MTNQEHPVLRFTDEAMSNLRTLAQEQPEMWANPDTDFNSVLRLKGVTAPTEPTGITAAGPIEMPIPKKGDRRQDTDTNAFTFADNLQGLKLTDIADGNLLAWLSCSHLLNYGTQRWRISASNDITTWIYDHFLPRSGRSITDYSTAGRPLWLAHIARKASEGLPHITEQQTLEHFVQFPEHYHQCTAFQIMRSTRILAEFVNAMLTETQGINRAGIRELARDINRAAGARILDTMTKKDIRTIIPKSPDRLMGDPRYAERKYLRVKPTLKVLSLGAGVQSTAMALMADKGHEGLEKPDFAIFADTGWEPKAVYQNIDWLKSHLSFPIITVSNGNIREHILMGINPEGRNFLDIPIYVMDENGKKGVATRQCTRVYKLDPIRKYLREKLEIPKGKRFPANIRVEMWLGITTDEAARQKDSDKEWITNRYPLIEKEVSRAQLVEWLNRNHPGRTFPKSACIGCPYHTDSMWKEMKDNDPESFQDAVNVDWALRNVPQCRGTLMGDGYLHKKAIPLSEVELDDTVPEGEAMTQECAGVCGV